MAALKHQGGRKPTSDHSLKHVGSPDTTPQQRLTGKKHPGEKHLGAATLRKHVRPHVGNLMGNYFPPGK